VLSAEQPQVVLKPTGMCSDHSC